MGVMNERRHRRQIDARGYTWRRIEHAQMRFNETEWKYQWCATSIVLNVNAAFAIFMAAVYYQTNLLQHILMPKLPGDLMISDIAKDVLASKSTILFYE